MKPALPWVRWRSVGMALLAAAILVPALYGFGTKFREFLLLVGDEEGAFTVVPILNYLLVSFGFLLLFVWAILHGMFRDIERPKHHMLANERRLDEEMRQEQDEERWPHG
jgi:nitrogen fixation-related uncharacterized protein